MTDPNATIHINIVDGGLSTQLYKYVSNVDGDPLWTARHLIEHPDDVRQAHLDFLRAGARVLITSTYQASVQGFKEHAGLTDDESKAMLESSVKLAREACEKFRVQTYSQDKILIAGGCGSYGAILHDEYEGKFAENVTGDFLKEWHRPRIESLLNAGVDLLAFETIPCSLEAKTLLELLKEYPHAKAWLSFSCRDYFHISNGEKFQTVVRECIEINKNQLVAIGINCTGPCYVDSLIRGLDTCGVPLVVNANSGEVYEGGKWISKTTGHLVAIEEFVKGWLDNGVRWIGGCCRVDAEKLAKIVKLVHEWQEEQNKQTGSTKLYRFSLD